MTHEFSHQHTAHCETGVMSSMLRHHGVDISEPMALGLSASLAFAYLPIVKLNGFPLIAYRMPPKNIIKGLQKRLGIKMRFEKFSSPDRGMEALDGRLGLGGVVGMQTSIFWLPYFPADMRFHFNAHNLIVYGKEGNEYLVSDPVFESPVRCTEENMRKSRFARGALAPKGLMYHIEDVPSSINYEKAIPEAIKANAKIMLAPFPVLGIRGMRFLAGKLRKLPTETHAVKKAKLYIGHIVRMQEEIGTGGAGFRFIYASFLQEAATKINSSLLSDASVMMTDVGDRLRVFALEAVKMCKNRNDLDLDFLSRLFCQCADEEEKVWRLLKKFKF